jgi:dolichyl-phosphate-mannose--protein O-mannosyl transferase
MRVPSALLGPAVPSDRWRAAATAGAVGLLAGVLRFRALGSPAAVVFDETYYAKDAWALLQTGAERVWAEGSNDGILVGDASGLTDQAAFASHPPLGKWVIAVGEAAAGLGPVGWRLGAAAMGTLAVVVMVYLARRVTRSTLLGGLAGLLLALDGLAVTTSRLALLDGTLLLLVVVAAAALVRDRDWSPWPPTCARRLRTSPTCGCRSGVRGACSWAWRSVPRARRSGAACRCSPSSACSPWCGRRARWPTPATRTRAAGRC